jgi:simple sugar transport system permease protein
MNTTKNTKGESGFLSYFVKFRSLSVFFVFLLLCIVFTVFSPGHRFISKENMEVFLALGAEFNIVALAVGMLMICGEFDLSVGSILVFCSFVFLRLFDTGVGIALAVLLTLSAGTLIGVLHGLITVRTGIPSFITTLGGMLFWRGLTLLWSQGFQRPLDTSPHPLFNRSLTGTIADFIPMQLLWFLAIALVLGLLIHFHKFGNWIFTTGDNKQAAKAMGINTDAVEISSFAIVGLICSFVAIMQIVRVGVFSSRAGDGWELKAIAASVVGGTALSGGIGSMAGIFLGTLIISVIENGLVVLRIPYYWTFVIFGIVIVSSVIISSLMEQKRLTIGIERDRGVSEPTSNTPPPT